MELWGGKGRNRVRDLQPMLTFCSHREGLTGIERDRKGLSGTEIVGVIGKDLEIIDWFAALSRRCPRAPLIEEQDIRAGLLRDAVVISRNLS
ncbi:MAG: hypothetical protein ACLP5H_00515 [Desulfomonilaceae bacterium]